MRIIVLTNSYPPCRFGWGCMQLCQEVTDGLSARRHAVAVLTSTYCDGDEIARPYPVDRLLSLEPDWHSAKSAAWQFWVGRRQRERQAIACWRELVAEFRPDIIFIWDYAGLARELLQEAERTPNAVAVYYLASYLPETPDEYVAYWQSPPIHWAARLLKRPVAKLALSLLAHEGKPISPKYEHVICVSDYIRRRLVSKGLVSAKAVVVYNGVDLAHFCWSRQGARQFAPGSLRCLVAGRVAPDKGAHTVIQALVRLKTQGSHQIKLTILGDGPQDYGEYLRKQVLEAGLQGMVEFRPPVPRYEMPEVLAHYDTLIMPSEVAEGLPRVMQEAMAAGLLVIGTDTGGSSELLVHEKTGLVFEAGNPESLATQLYRALCEPSLITQLAENGRETVIRDFDIRHTIDQIERYLADLAGGT